MESRRTPTSRQEFEPRDDETVVTHTRNSAFHNSTLGECLFLLDVRRLICCGVSTAYAVEGTVRHATDLGYEVVVAADACSTATQAQHEASLQAMRLIAEVVTVEQLLAGFNATDQPSSG